MSTTTTPAAHVSPAGSHGVTFLGVVRSEWIKFWSLRSTKLLLLLTFVAIIGVGVLAAWLRGIAINELVLHGVGGPRSGGPGMSLAAAQAEAATRGLNIFGIPNAGLNIGVLILGSLAVMLVASEFTTGMIRSSMTAVPKRLPVFWAKAIVLVVVSYVLTVVAALVTFVASIPLLHIYGISMNFGIDGVVYGIFTGGLYVAGVALIGLSLGTLMRNSAGGIVLLVALFFVLTFATQLLGLIPGDFWQYVNQYIPSVAGGRMLEVGSKAAFITPGEGGLIFLGWILVIMAPAVVSLKVRDV